MREPPPEVSSGLSSGSNPHLPDRYSFQAGSIASETPYEGGGRLLGGDVKPQTAQQAENVLLQHGPLAYFSKHTSICYVLDKDLLDVDLDTPEYNYIPPSRKHPPYLYSLTRNANIIQAQGSGIINFTDNKGNVIPVLAWYVPKATTSKGHPVMVGLPALLSAGYRFTSYSMCHYQFSHPKHGSVWVFRIQGQFLLPIKTPVDIDAFGAEWCRLTDVKVRRINQEMPTDADYADNADPQRNLVTMNKCLHSLFAHADQTQIIATFKGFLCDEIETKDIAPVACGECREYATEPRLVGDIPSSRGFVLTFFVEVFNSPKYLPTTSGIKKTESLKLEKTICFEEVGSGFLYLRNVDQKYGCLSVLHNLINDAFRERRPGKVLLIKASKSKKLLTISREDVDAWARLSNPNMKQFIDRYVGLSEKNGHLDDKEFDALCWNMAYDRAHIAVTDETAGIARPELERFIVKRSRKLLVSLGLPTLFAQFAAIHFVNTHNIMYGSLLKPGVLQQRFNWRSQRNLRLPLQKFSNCIPAPPSYQTFGCLVSYREGEPDSDLPYPRPGYMGVFVGISSEGYEVVDLETHVHHFVKDVEFYPKITPLKYEYPGWKGAPPDPNGAKPLMNQVRPLRMDSIAQIDWSSFPHDLTVNFGDSIARNRAVPVAVYFRGTTESLPIYTNQTAFGLFLPQLKVPLEEITSTLPETIWET